MSSDKIAVKMPNGSVGQGNSVREAADQADKQATHEEDEKNDSSE